jgi:hypothetical protein
VVFGLIDKFEVIMSILESLFEGIAGIFFGRSNSLILLIFYA